MRIAELLREAATRLATESPRLDAEVLLCHVLQRPRVYLYSHSDTELEAQTIAHFESLLARRLEHVPIAHLTGEKEFWSLNLEVSPDTLLPRPDTECLVEFCLELELPVPTEVLDLGTGTGAIALALASERPDWKVTGVDRIPAAVTLARRNAQRTGVTNTSFLLSDWYTALSGRQFQLIVSNPPYIDQEDPHLRQGDVKHEPSSALVAAENGLADIERIASQAHLFLSPGGLLCIEHGYAQGDAVRQIFRRAGMQAVATGRDYGGQERFTYGSWQKPGPAVSEKSEGKVS